MSSIAQEIRSYRQVRLRQFESMPRGGSREKILALYPNGQFEYLEIEQHPGPVGPPIRQSDSGTWDAEGDRPSGVLILRWASGGATRHSFHYVDGETCQVDGKPAYISAG
jgi:hypothetical protein